MNELYVRQFKESRHFMSDKKKIKPPNVIVRIVLARHLPVCVIELKYGPCTLEILTICSSLIDHAFIVISYLHLISPNIRLENEPTQT